MAYRFETLAREYATLWDGMHITRDLAGIDRQVARITAHKAAYLEVERATRVPWYVVGIIDMREGGGGARTHLHNGDSLAARTVQVPAGRPKAGGPPFTFVESACDAMRLEGFDAIDDWSVERIAFTFERMNGFGYRQKRIDIPSPYLWGGTNIQQPGKYIRDRVFSATLVDPQMGAMPLLHRLAERCPEITLHSMYGATPDPADPTPASNVAAGVSPTVPHAVAATGGLTLASGLANGLSGDPVDLTGKALALKGNAVQLLAGVDLMHWGVPGTIIVLVIVVLLYARAKA